MTPRLYPNPVTARRSRARRWWLPSVTISAMSLMVILTFGAASLAGGTKSEVGFYLGGVVCGLILLGGVVGELILVDRERSFVRSKGFRVCPACWFDLSGLGERGTCPECGDGFDQAWLEAVWARTWDPPRLPGGPQNGGDFDS